MSHEMRTPLQAIVGVMEFLSETALDERQARWVQMAQRASDRLSGLLNGVLDISSDDAASAAGGPVAVEAVVHASVSLIEPIAIMRPVALRLVSEPDARLFVHADGDRLSQVLVNLLSNAIRFSPPAGMVTVATREVDSRVQIEVEDQGRGIAQSCADRVFRPFDRLDAAERGIAGTGLGLSLSRSFVQAMHGTLEVVQRAGAGAIFRVELPLLPSPTGTRVPQ
jgi:signal transduction histidine kinase